MMKLHRTIDVDLIRAIVSNPEIDVTEGEVAVPIADSIYYLVAKDDFNEIIGVLCFMPMNTISWNPHIVVLPQHRGSGTEFMKLGVEWMFENTPCQKVIAFPPIYNTAMIRVFEKCGFELEGYSPDSFMFKGVVYDRLLLGIGK